MYFSKLSSPLSLLFLAYILAAIQGCRMDEGPNPNNIVQIPGTFEVRFHEEIGHFTRSLVLDLNTLRYYECTNYSILTEKEYTDGVLEISLKDVLPPETCLSGNAQARDTISLGYLIEGERPIRFRVKSVIENDGTLHVQADRYTLEMESEDGLEIKRYELMRLPENLVWGYISYESSLANVANDFLNELASITMPAQLLDGDYAWFSWSQGALVEAPHNEPISNDYITQTFVRRSGPEAEGALQDLIDAYFAQGLDLTCYTGWKGLL